MKNTTEDLNNHLMMMMEELSDPDLEPEQLDLLTRKTRAAGDLARVMIENNRLVLDASKAVAQMGQQNAIPSHVVKPPELEAPKSPKLNGRGAGADR